MLFGFFKCHYFTPNFWRFLINKLIQDVSKILPMTKFDSKRFNVFDIFVIKEGYITFDNTKLKYTAGIQWNFEPKKHSMDIQRNII